MFEKRFVRIMLVVSVLSLLLAVGGMTVKAQNQQLPSQERSNNITITPELVSQIGGPMYAVAWQDNYAYVGVGPRLYILDVSNPAHPVFTGNTGVLPGIVQDVDVVGSYAYIASGYGGLSIIDISNPAAPKAIGFINTPGSAQDVTVMGNYAYIGDGGSIRIIDVSKPSAPIEVWSSEPPDLPEVGFYDPNETFYFFYTDIAVTGKYAYVTSVFQSTSHLGIIDISNPAAPISIGFLYIPGIVMGVVVAGDYAYIAADGSGLRIIDISNPADPIEVGFHDTIGAEDVAVVGNYAYVTEWYRFHIVDISNPAAPTSISYYDTPGYTQGLAVEGSYAYLVNSLTGLRIMDVLNPAAPKEAGYYTTPTPDSARGVVVLGNYTYVADGRSGLRIIDISDPADPLEVGFYDTPGNAEGVTMVGNFAYIADDGSGLRIIDISDPEAPLETGFYDTQGYALGVAVDDNYAYIADDIGGLRIIDISDPSAPIEVGYYATPGYYYDVSVAGDYVFIADGGGFLIFDVSNPAAPTIIGSYDRLYITGIDVVGDYAYLADAWSGLRIVDISNPSAPVEVGFYDLPGDSATDVVVAGNYAYVARELDGLWIIDISDPAGPMEAGFYDTSGNTRDMAVAGNYAYVADRDGGLVILGLLTEVTESIPINGGSLTSADGSTSLIFPSGAFTQTVNITYRQMFDDENVGELVGIGHTFDISAVYSDTGEVADLVPGQTFTITVAYSDSEIGPALEDTLELFSWNDTAWVREPTSTLDPVNNVITATPNHLSMWAILGETNRVFLPMARK